jgi:predicted outer membrane repeat protein
MRHSIELKWVAALAVLLFVVGCSDDDNGVEPDTGGPVLVRPDGSGDHATIQEAIDAAAEGDTVMLASGVFRGNGNRDLQYRGKAITVMSQSGNPETCIIDCQGSGEEPHRGFNFHMQEDAQSILTGVKIINGFEESGGAVLCTDVSSPTIENCIFLNNLGTDAAGGMHLHDQSDAKVRDCTFRANTSGGAGGGIYISESSPEITNCTFIFNSTSQGHPAGGVAIYNSSAVFTNCTISDNSPSGIDCADAGPTLQNTIVAFSIVGPGIACGDSCDIVLNCCDIYGNAGGDSTECIVHQFGTRHNFSADPLFCDRDAHDFHLLQASPCNPESTVCGLIGALPVGCR